MPTTPSPSAKRILELDGLRGVAIILVLIDHYIGTAASNSTNHSLLWVSRFASEGAHGVDLFFVLSGFLIGGILLRARNSHDYFRTFYIRRFFRIIPLYYVWIALGGLIMLAARAWGGTQFFQLAIPFWTFPLFLQNFFPGETPFQLCFFVPLWSLAVEEQFYLLAPALIRFLKPRRLVQVLVCVLVGAPLLRWALVARFSWGNFAAYHWMICRSDSLAAGVLLAFIWQAGTTRVRIVSFATRRYWPLLCILIISAIGMAAALARENASGWIPRLAREALPFFFSLAIILALSLPSGAVAKILRAGTLQWFGKVSYCTYIIHWAVNWTSHAILLHSVPRIDSLGAIAATLIALLATMGIAEASWRFLESPLLRIGHRYTY